MKWNPELYEEKRHFVPEYGRGLLAYLPEQTDLSILDLGCGTGLLTRILAEKGHRVVGIDNSAEMIGKAQTLYPHISFETVDALALPWSDRSDVVFSNAVFHWIREPRLLLQNVWKTLKPVGRLICEFGADRPTPLNNGVEGMRHWIRQFFAGELRRLKEREQAELLDEMDASLKEELWDGAQWVTDYRRLRVSAVKSGKAGK